MPELEEPGWPNLRSGAPSPGATFLNAFYAMSQMNVRKRQVEDQMMRLNLQLQKQQFDEQFKEADFQRKLEGQQITGLLRERALEQQDEFHRASADIAYQRLGVVEEAAKNKYQATQKSEADTQEFTKEVGELRQQYTPGTQPYWEGYQAIRGRHVDALNSKSGQQLDRGYEQENKSAQDLIHKQAKMAMDTLRMSLSTNAKGGAWQLTDLQRPPEDFRTEKGNIIIAERPVVVPGTKTQIWQTIPGSEISQLSAADQKKKYPGLRQRWVSQDQYNRWMDLKKTTEDYSGGGKNSPSTARKTLDDSTARQFLLQAGGDRNKARQLATDAGYDF